MKKYSACHYTQVNILGTFRPLKKGGLVKGVHLIRDNGVSFCSDQNKVTIINGQYGGVPLY